MVCLAPDGAEKVVDVFYRASSLHEMMRTS
jgi:hypothetical protein